MKPFDIALVMGRFNGFHNGHKSIVDLALDVCDRVLIVVGSSQETGTLRNPFSVETRIECIKSVFDDRVTVRSLADMTHENDISEEWGRYLLKHVKQMINKTPDVMVYGNDESRSRWFDSKDIKDVTEIIVNRNKLPISATMMRDYLLENNVDEWHKHTPSKMHKYYERLRSELLAASPYKSKFNQLVGINKEDKFLKEQPDFA